MSRPLPNAPPAADGRGDPSAPYTDFERARLRGLAAVNGERRGIGTLGERSLHAVLKYWADPDESHHEAPLGIGRLVADVFDGARVTEIQTRSFSTLRSKLERLLKCFPVTVIYPLARRKTLVWVDPVTGEMTPPRRSPKTGGWGDAFHELYRLRPLLGHPGLTLRLVLIDVEEYRLRDGWAREGKRGSHRMERIPTALGECAVLAGPRDFAGLLPPALEPEFTTRELAAAFRVSRPKAGEIGNILYNLDVIQRIGKRGNAYVYRRSEIIEQN